MKKVFALLVVLPLLGRCSAPDLGTDAASQACGAYADAYCMHRQSCSPGLFALDWPDYPTCKLYETNQCVNSYIAPSSGVDGLVGLGVHDRHSRLVVQRFSRRAQPAARLHRAHRAPPRWGRLREKWSVQEHVVSGVAGGRVRRVRRAASTRRRLPRRAGHRAVVRVERPVLQRPKRVHGVRRAERELQHAPDVRGGVRVPLGHVRGRPNPTGRRLRWQNKPTVLDARGPRLQLSDACLVGRSSSSALASHVAPSFSGNSTCTAAGARNA